MSLRQYLMIKQAVRYTNDGMAVPDDEPNDLGVPIPVSNKPTKNPIGRNFARLFGLGSPWRGTRQGNERPDQTNPNSKTPISAVDRVRAAVAGGLGKARKKFGPPPFPSDEPPMPVDDWARGEYYRAMANKENNLGMLSLGGGALTGGITAALMNKYYNGDKVNDWLNKHLVSDPTTNYGRFMTRANKALSGALPGISTIAASLLGGLGTRFIANKLHKRYRAIPKPANSSELGDVAKQEWLNGGFDGTELPGGWYVPPVENSRGRLAPAYGVADPIPAPEKDSHGDYWNPQVKRGPLMRN